MLPELRDDSEQVSGLSREFSSQDNVVSLQETAALLERHGLLVEQADASGGGELLV
jgi:hypothetical protein